MKKILLSVFTLGIITVNAQTFVSITAENKNIVLEEFTGIYCTYCPDGHLLAQQLYDSNPGDVVLINIHEGSYADPSGNDPDFRTPFGTAITGQSNILGYPAGTINRHEFGIFNSSAPAGQQWTQSQNGGTAMSRGDWATTGGTILSQSSPVNVAAQASIDISTRLLTVVVEAYYTGNSSTTTNKLNVALLQNNVEGPQTGAASFNPTQILANGNYNHQHMLRHLLTGQWGELISTTTSGSFYTNTYTYTIPNNLNGIAYDLFNLDVAVFIAEGNQEVTTGEIATMSHIVPPGVNLIDMETSSNMTLPASYCDNMITPEITITNNSTTAIDTFEVTYSLNGGAPISQIITTSLAAGANTTITFNAITVPYGQNSISYNANTVAGTSFIDNVSGNNSSNSGAFYTMSATAFGTNHTEGFENLQTGATTFNNAILENPNEENTFVVDNTISQSVAWNLGGFGNSTKSYRFRLGSFTPGNYASIVYEKIDFSSTTNNEVRFSYAHAQMNSSNTDKLQILVSTDCGITWNIAGELSGNNLVTAPADNTNYFYPQTTQWAAYSVDLSAYDGNSEVMIAFKAICGGGNNLYIDDIEIDVAQTASINNFTSNTAIYPNPVKNVLTIEGTYTSATIYDVFGKLVLTTNAQKTIDVSALSNGVYFVNIISENKLTVKKITVAK
ncbi:MAG: Omp28-related outer membrane protein [Flavobacteriales bacterium]|nr:Omp28-related outer membrane protein [Flavobacteriales bacterium]